MKIRLKLGIKLYSSIICLCPEDILTDGYGDEVNDILG